MSTIFGNAAVCLTMAACAGLPAQVAYAEQDFRVNTLIEDDLFRVTDARTGKVIIETDDTSFHYYIPRRGAALEPELDIVPMTNGFDMVYTFTNDRTIDMPIGAVEFNGLKLGNEFDYRRLGSDGYKERVDASNPVNRFYFGYPHGPRSPYSPVAVVETEDHVIGVSILYPVLEWEHDALGTLERTGGSSGDDWRLRWKLSNFGNDRGRLKVRHPTKLAPGETRTYTVCVRITDNHDKWIGTLTPYRDFFQQTLGGVTYERDARPIVPFSLAGRGLLSNENPYGFRQEEFRPDIHGFGPLLDWYADRDVQNRRVLFWQPSGLQRFNLDNNLPFKFTSFWSEGDQYGHAMGDAPQEFQRFVTENNIDLGFWWGQSTRIAREWDVAESEILDPENSEHVAIACAEIDAAVAAGATFFGLDAFGSVSAIPVWDLVKWLEILNERYPDITFVAEKHKPDIVHRLAGNFYQAYNKGRSNPSSVEEVRKITNPHPLSNFVLPGSEIWLSFRFEIPERVPGFIATPEFQRSEFEWALEGGYIPIMFGMYDWDPSTRAANYWENIPDDLPPAYSPIDPVDGSGEQAEEELEPANPRLLQGGQTRRTVNTHSNNPGDLKSKKNR